ALSHLSLHDALPIYGRGHERPGLRDAGALGRDRTPPAARVPHRLETPENPCFPGQKVIRRGGITRGPWKERSYEHSSSRCEEDEPMFELDADTGQFANINEIGVDGGGCNAVSRRIE